MNKILITDPLSENGINILKEAGFDVINMPGINSEDLIKILPGIDGWIIRSGTKINKKHFQYAEQLKVIGRAGVGVDNIDIVSATENGIVVMNVPDGNTISAAEHTMALTSALSRNIQEGHLSLMKGKWKRSELVGNELRQKTLGVVGLGKIGREVIKRALGYEMKILGYDPYVNKKLFESDNINIVDFEELLEKSDYITVHVPLIDSTRSLFNYEVMSKMKSSARIINVARGGIINEADLVKVLDEGKISGAAIDVFENEPLNHDNPLIKARNILLTPHLGASTFEAKEGVSTSICNQVVDFLKDDKMSNAINLPVSDMDLLKTLEPYLKLGNVIGSFLSQLVKSPIVSLEVESFGLVQDTKPIMLSVLKGILKDITDVRINYVNVLSLAEERGILLKFSHNTSSVSYSNLIKVRIETEMDKFSVEGCLFDTKMIKFTNIMGYQIDFSPLGNMLIVKNKDIPGVVGKVGTALASHDINIAEFILSRKKTQDLAYSIIKIDGNISEKVLKTIENLDEIIDIKQIHING
ncbi:MAG: phosphoglycerate dehydrogenase [Candidatus Marinimicrobia bacterium]|nr:phosphoglycerate dehydrogenase [Candidatus Neomarinimicrobiota bacterium]|tara:strand:- start:2752 stop:4335 length:1584 start_codon:yes stop_codon:yes gene_type:complete